MKELFVLPEIRIPLAELELTYVRSSGPGGQNVNKVNSKAQLRWNLLGTVCLSEAMRARLLFKLGARLTREGDLLVASDVFRDQGRNRDECLARLKAILTEAAHVPKKRKKSKPSWSSQQKAQNSRKLHSEKKRRRSGFD